MDAIYLFNSGGSLRKIITSEISECIHEEHQMTLTASIPLRYHAVPGEYLGMVCADGAFRKFEIDDAQDDETEETTALTCTDAAAGELEGLIVERISVTQADAAAAAQAVLAGTGWRVESTSAGEYKADLKATASDAWSLLATVRDKCAVRIVPCYAFDGQQITDKIVRIEDRVSAFRGRILQSDVLASGMSVTRTGSPRPMVYGLGATDENDEQLTFAGIQWSTENGDPVDKPLGQSWVGVPEAVAAYPGRGMVHEVTGCKDAGELLRICYAQALKSAAPATGASAFVSDIEMTDPDEGAHMSLRLYDLVAIVTKRGEVVMMAIIGISRNYARPWETKIKLGHEGDREMDIARDVAQLKQATIRASRGGSGAGAAAERNYTLLMTQDAKIEENRTKLSTVLVELDAVNTTLTAKAEKQDLTEATARITAAELRLDGAQASIELMATKTEVDELGESISATGIVIDGLNEEILLRAKTTYVDSEVTAVKNLIAEEIEAVRVDAYANIADVVTTKVLNVSNNANFTNGSIRIGGELVSKTTINVVTEFTQALGESAPTAAYTLLTVA